ncbi:MAG TPA: amino acid adenylation domain-containing protein [Methylomirabilota bacterium]|jgi:amino acid adenylation domain-containing protein
MIRRLEDVVTDQADRRPEALAVGMRDVRLTYAAVETASNRLAHALRAAGVRRGDRVALCLRKSPGAVVAILATLKAGAVYVPLDTASPVRRLARMLRLAAPRCVLAEAAVASVASDALAGLEGDFSVAVGWLDGPPPTWRVDRAKGDFTPADVATRADAPVGRDGATGDPAYILFTSGSTGIPKGVVITHANVLHFIDWAAKYFGLGPTDRASGHAPLHFDLSVLDIFGTLAAGGQLHMIPSDLAPAPDALPRFIREAALTQWFSVPSALSYLVAFDAVRPHDFPSLERLMWCGDVLPTPVLRRLMALLPHVTFTNLYGPTETTVASSFYTVSARPADDAAVIPIGTPCDGEELRVLDRAGQPAADGEIGELHIGGVGLGAGYWRDPETTAAAFTTGADGVRLYRTGDLARRGADGLVYFVGRADTQIKSRGYRIELGEIEAALHQLPGVRESAIVAIDTGGFEGATICCAYAPVDGALSPVTLRRALAGLLPAYMLPARWQRLDALPKNANGKIDRPAIRAAFVAAGRGEGDAA